MSSHYRDFLIDLSKVFGIFLNAFLFFRIITYTFISVSNLFLAFFSLMCIGLVIYKFFRLKINKYLFFLILLPLLFNIFFLINYIYSEKPHTETYRYAYGITDIKGNKGRYSSKKGRSTTVYLEHGVYKEFYFPRMFFDYEKMKDKRIITYYTEEGLFGLKVIKDYKFSYDNLNHIFQY